MDAPIVMQMDEKPMSSNPEQTTGAQINAIQADQNNMVQSQRVLNNTQPMPQSNTQNTQPMAQNNMQPAAVGEMSVASAMARRSDVVSSRIRLQERVADIQKRSKTGWKYGLFDCFEAIPVLVTACCCPCIVPCC